MSAQKVMLFLLAWIASLCLTAAAHAANDYPPGCLAGQDLWLPPSQLQIAGELQLPAVLTNGAPAGTERVRAAVRRLTCSPAESVVLLYLYDDDISWFFPPYFQMPEVRMTQGRWGWNDVITYPYMPQTSVRVVPGTPFEAGQVLVLSGPGREKIQDAFRLSLRPHGSNAAPLVIDVPAYTPGADAAQPLALSGYLSGNYYDPDHSGEGIIVEIGEIASGAYIQVAWMTYDNAGNPFWLFGGGDFNHGARRVDIPVIYSRGGGFAGSGHATQQPWGRMQLNFPDCGSVQFAYASNPGVGGNVPRGQGSRSWKRLTTLQGLQCD